jgi:pimeloyl-ACP methyl ester carboxylesterase
MTIKKQGYFFTGGSYNNPADGDHMVGHMYVEYQIPEKQTSHCPIIMIHGAGLTGVTYTGTPDDRPGWRDYFLSRGWPVYVVDQVGRGRSSYIAEAYGPRRPLTSAKAREAGWARVTNWPGTGRRGDPAFDQFMMSLDAGMADLRAGQERLTNHALVELLDRIGPAVVLVHSQAGVNGWHALDQRPNLVRAVVSIEPFGPPFQNAPYGITSTPLRFSPPISDVSDFELEQQKKPDFPGAVLCWLQKEPAKFKLPNMASANAPILILSSAEGNRRNSDHGTKLFLEQAGVSNVEHIKLGEVGILGHGHMMMIEKNNLQIAELIEKWLTGKLMRR